MLIKYYFLTNLAHIKNQWWIWNHHL